MRVQVYAGRPGKTEAFADGAPDTATFCRPVDLLGDGSGHVLVADSANHCIRLIDCSTRHVAVWAGQPKKKGYEDGPALQALFSEPCALARDAAGTVFVADFGNNCVRRVRLFALTGQWQTDTLAGHPPHAGDDEDDQALAVDGTGGQATQSLHRSASPPTLLARCTWRSAGRCGVCGSLTGR